MAVTIEMPREVERQLRAAHPNLERRLLEGYVVDGYRSGELSSCQVGEILGLEGRAATMEFLGARGAFPDYDLRDLEDDLRHVERIAAPPPR